MHLTSKESSQHCTVQTQKSQESGDYLPERLKGEPEQAFGRLPDLTSYEAHLLLLLTLTLKVCCIACIDDLYWCCTALMFTRLCHAFVGNPHVTLLVIHTAHVICTVHIFDIIPESYMLICCTLRLLLVLSRGAILVCCVLHCSEQSSEENWSALELVSEV